MKPQTNNYFKLHWMLPSTGEIRSETFTFDDRIPAEARRALEAMQMRRRALRATGVEPKASVFRRTPTYPDGRTIGRGVPEIGFGPSPVRLVHFAGDSVPAVATAEVG